MPRRMPHFETGSGYTGKIFERELFGEFDVTNPAYQTELKRVMRPGDYVSFRDAVDLVKRFSKDNPTDPSRTFLRDLRLEVLDALGRKKILPDDTVQAYVSVGTPMDFKHAADAFLAIKQNSHEEIIRIDASVRKEKIASAAAGDERADIVIGERGVPDAVQDADEYLRVIARYADKVLLILDKRYQERKERAAAAA